MRATDRGWFEEWKGKLPLGTLLRLIAVLQPKVLEFTMANAVDDEKKIIEFIRRTTLVGLLPVPHPILIRRYQSNRTAMTSLWFTPFIWNVILRRNSALFFSEKLSADQAKELVASA